jgi:hypothetical protein
LKQLKTTDQGEINDHKLFVIQAKIKHYVGFLCIYERNLFISYDYINWQENNICWGIKYKVRGLHNGHIYIPIE